MFMPTVLMMWKAAFHAAFEACRWTDSFVS
jgi:hypothetical protein